MTAPPESVTDTLIAATGAAGMILWRDGETIRMSAPRPPAPELLDQIRAAKPLLLPVLPDAADWRARHRAALAHWSMHDADAAAAFAWALALADGCRVHSGDGLECVIRYGERWRAAASAALTAMGAGTGSFPRPKLRGRGGVQNPR